MKKLIVFATILMFFIFLFATDFNMPSADFKGKVRIWNGKTLSVLDADESDSLTFYVSGDTVRIRASQPVDAQIARKWLFNLMQVDSISVVSNLSMSSAVIDATDIAKIDGITDGTVAASKAVVVDANKDISEFRKVGAQYVDLANQTSLQSSITTDKSRVYPYNDGSDVHVMVTKNNNTAETRVKLAEQSSITALSINPGIGYFFNGSSSMVKYNDAANYWVGKGRAYTVICKFKCSDVTTSQVLVDLTNASSDRAGLMVQDGYVYWGVYNGSTSTYVSSSGISANRWYTVAIVHNADNTKYMYLDGVRQSGTSGTMNIDGAAGFIIGTRNAENGYWFSGSISYVLVFNATLTAAEIQQICESGVDYRYKGATQTELLSGKTWTNGTFDSFTSSGNEITSASDDGSSSAYANAGQFTFVAGKSYELVVTLGGTWTSGYFSIGFSQYNDGTGQHVFSSCYINDVAHNYTRAYVSNGTTYARIRFVALYSGSYYLTVRNSANPITNLSLTSPSLKQIGCVAEYLPEGVDYYSWIDNSGNGLHGLNMGAIPFGWKVGDTRIAYLSTTSTSPTMTDVQRGGWRVKSIVMETAQNLTEIDVTQETSGIELLSNKTLNNGIMVWNSIADHNIYPVGTDKDLIFKLTGNGGSGTKIYVNLEKVF